MIQFCLFAFSFAWMGRLHRRGFHRNLKLRAHEDNHAPVHAVEGTHFTQAKSQVAKSLRKGGLSSKPMHNYFQLGNGSCLYSNESVPSTSEKRVFSEIVQEAACEVACTHHDDCRAYSVNNFGCNLYVKPDHGFRASLDSGATTQACFLKTAADATSYPFHGVFVPREGVCVGKPTGHEFGLDENNNGEAVDSPQECGVICAAYTDGYFVYSTTKKSCFCGKGTKADCSDALGYHQYHIAYPKANEDCPDGGRNIPSRFVKSGENEERNDDQKNDNLKWEVVTFTAGETEGCLELCAKECVERGASCHGYACSRNTASEERTVDSAGLHKWFNSFSQGSWSGQHLECRLATKHYPLPIRQPLSPSSPKFRPGMVHIVCARRDCLEHTVCSGPEFHRISGFVLDYSANKISTAVEGEDCEECATKCKEDTNCKMYQCSESLMAVDGKACLLFNSYEPEHYKPFNVSDVALCRRMADKACQTVDGFSAVSQPCACGTQTCPLDTACLKTETGTAECRKLPSGCLEGEVLNVATQICVSEVSCASNANCTPAVLLPIPCPIKYVRDETSGKCILDTECNSSPNCKPVKPPAQPCQEGYVLTEAEGCIAASECDSKPGCNIMPVVGSPCPDGEVREESKNLCVNATDCAERNCTITTPTLSNPCPTGQVRDSETNTCITISECKDKGCTTMPTVTTKPPPVCALDSTCPSAPLAKQCVTCSDGSTTEPNACAALCKAGTRNCTIVDGPCDSPSNCTNEYTSNDVVCGDDGKAYRSDCDLAASGVNQSNQEPPMCGIVAACRIGESNCKCGEKTCKAPDYCTGDGACAKLCEASDPNQKDCLCHKTTGNTSYDFCTGYDNYCLPSSLESIDKSVCAPDGPCVKDCNHVDIKRPACRCGTKFCCDQEICVKQTAGTVSLSQSHDADTFCVKKCQVTGETGCSCVFTESGGNTAIEECDAGRRAYFEGGQTCKCQKSCAFGESGCTCYGSNADDAHNATFCDSEKNETCSARPGSSDNSCVKQCETGQSDCLCALGETYQKCGDDTTCTTETVTDAFGEVIVCVKTCADGESNCKCGGDVCTGGKVCDNGSTTPSCVDGCTDGVEATGLCPCGIDSNGEKVECNNGQVCSKSVSTGSGSIATCSAEAPKICGTTDNNITIDNYKSLFGLVAHGDTDGKPCICSLTATNTKTMCNVGTYCSYQTETCLAKRVSPCSKHIVLDEPCYCNDLSSPAFSSLPLGICSRGDMCVHPESRSCAYPVARCRSGVEGANEDCFCNSGERQEYCGDGKECVVNLAQTSPSASECGSNAANCSLSLSHYGHCEDKTPAAEL